MHVAEADAGRTDRRHAARRQKVADVRRPADVGRDATSESALGRCRRSSGPERGPARRDRPANGRWFRCGFAASTARTISSSQRMALSPSKARVRRISMLQVAWSGTTLKSFAAREVRHRGGGSERKRGVMRFGKGRGRHLERKGGGLVQRIDAGPLDLARVRRLAGKMQPGAQEAAAAHHDAVVAGIAQRHGVGRPRDGVEIGAHAAEAAGMLVGVEQHVHRTARNRRLGQVSRDMGQDGDARFGIGGAATQQPPAAHGAAEGRLGPLIEVARRGGVDAGIEAKHGTGRGTRDLDQHGDVLAFAVTQQTRLQMIVCEPGMDDAKHRLRRIDAAARRRRHQPRRQLHDAVDRRRAHGAG